MEFYLLKCSKCKKETKHIQSGVNRLRGIKFMCLVCMNKTKYVNAELFNKNKKEVKNEDNLNPETS